MEEAHPGAWLAWLAAAALPPLLTRNPLYLSLLVLATGVTYLTFAHRSPAAQGWGAFVRLGAFLWLLTVPFTMLTAHYGRLVLFQLPAAWPVVGGPITGEAFLYGLSSGLSLIALLLAFATFNVVVDQARLLRMTPGFLYQVGVTAAIAVAFVPQMVASWQAIREAQLVRGHRVRGLRDLLPLLMPLLTMALERAMQLAESMEARGFGRQAPAGSGGLRTLHLLAMLAGLGALGLGFGGLSFWPERTGLLVALCAAGGAALAWSFWDQGRRVQRSRYRRWQWGAHDRVVLMVGGVALVAWLALWLLRGEWLFYYPYPPYNPWPDFQPLPGLLVLLAAVPGVLRPGGRAGAPPEGAGER